MPEIDDRATCYDCANGFNGKKKTNAPCGHVFKKDLAHKEPVYNKEFKIQQQEIAKKQQKVIAAAIAFVKAYNEKCMDDEPLRGKWKVLFADTGKEAAALFDAVENLDG